MDNFRVRPEGRELERRADRVMAQGPVAAVEGSAEGTKAAESEPANRAGAAGILECQELSVCAEQAETAKALGCWSRSGWPVWFSRCQKSRGRAMRRCWFLRDLWAAADSTYTGRCIAERFS